MAYLEELGSRNRESGHYFNNVHVEGRAHLGDTYHIGLDPLGQLPYAVDAPIYSKANEHQPTCLADTRVDLLNEIYGWAEGQDGRHIFWLRGLAGTGKSTIARTVARHYHNKKRLAASFFFLRGGGDVGHAGKFVTSIAVQLAYNVPVLRKHICDAVAERGDIASQSLRDQWQHLVLRPLSKPHEPGPYYIVIDALDECDNNDNIQIIVRLLAEAQSPERDRLRVFLTSRPEGPIRHRFRQITDEKYKAVVLHDIPPSIIGHDIQLFFEERLKKIAEDCYLPNDWPGVEDIRRLVQSANGLFIWAATACRFVQEGGSFPIERLQTVLKDSSLTEELSTDDSSTEHSCSDNHFAVPPDKHLDLLYLTVLRRLVQRYSRQERKRWYNLIRETLGAIVLLGSPLSVFAIAQLLRVPADNIHRILDGLHSIVNVPQEPTRLVRLHHPSFRDFLLNRKRCNDNFWVDQTSTHEKLASRCLELMSAPHVLQRDICNLSEPGMRRSEIDESRITTSLPPELQYACRYWVHHLKQSQGNISDKSIAHTFLQKHFLHWLEVMSLLGDTNKCVSLLETLSTLVELSNSALSMFLHDAQRFTLRFQYILQDAPLQIYSSALIFAPEKSVVRKAFASEMPGWITLLSKREYDWDAYRSLLEGHTDDVRAVAFSPDGQLVASASSDRTVRVWETVTGSCRSVLKGHTNTVWAVSFSQDSQLVMSASSDRTLRVWETATGSCRIVFGGYTTLAWAVAFSPDSQLVVSAPCVSTVRVWETATWSCRSVLEGHTAWARAVAFSPDSQLVVSGSDDRTVRVWEIASESCRSVLKGHTDMVWAVAFSLDGQLVVSASCDRTVRVWEIATESCRRVLKGHTGWVTAVAFSPDSQLVVSGSDDRAVRVWETATGSCRSVLKGHTNTVRAVAFSPDGQLVVSASSDNTVRVWETAIESCRRVPQGHTDDVRAVAFSPDGQLVVSASDDSTVRVWEAATGTCRSVLKGHTNPVRAVAFSPDGQLVVSVSHDTTVRVWETATGSCRSVLEGHATWIRAGVWVRAVAFSPDGQLVVSAPCDRTVRVWETATGSCRSVLKGHIDNVGAVAFSPDGQLVVSASDDRTVRVWETATESCRSVLKGHTDTVRAVAFSPDSQLVVSGSDDRTVRLWEIAKESCRRVLKGHTDMVWAVAFSLDGQLVVSASDDRTVRVWETTTGSCRSVLEGHTSSAWDVAFLPIAFSPDGQYIQTDRGDIALYPPNTPFPSLKWSQLSPISVQDQWISLGQQRLLWLPFEYRPACTTVNKNVVCLGHSSGRITFLEFGME